MQRTLPFSLYCTGNPRGRDTLTLRPSTRPAEKPLYLCHVFTLLHPSKLQAYQCDCQVHGMPTRYIREECFFGISLSILGQRPSRTTSIHRFSCCLSRDNLATMRSFHALSRKRVCSTSLLFAQYATISYPGTFYRAGLTLTDQLQLDCSLGLSRSLPSR